jgi:hypothetical protein
MSGYDQIGLEALELRFDGPIPESHRRAHRAGAPATAVRIKAEAELRFLKRRIGQHIDAIRASRSGQRDDTPLRRDLAVYRRAWQRWRKVLRDAA